MKYRCTVCVCVYNNIFDNSLDEIESVKELGEQVCICKKKERKKRNEKEGKDFEVKIKKSSVKELR